MSVRRRVLIGTVAGVGVLGGSIGLYAAPSPEHAATEVQVEDTAGILYEPDLREGIAEVRFYEPTTVAVFTHRGGPEARWDDYALNDAVLAHARENRPDWLSDNQQKWADDLYIFAVDPEGRLVGTYFGENRKVDEDAQLDIQEATKDELRRGQWTDGAVTGVEAAAARMNRPFSRSPFGIALLGVGSATALGVSGAYVGVGVWRTRRSRAARAEGDRAMANVVGDYEVTEIHARLIPEESRYGGAMLERYREYTEKFRELTELGNQARSVPERDYDRSETVKLMERYRDAATALDQLDDVIADTAALLNKDHNWEEAWQRQVAELRDDLAGTDDLLSSGLPKEMRGLPEGQQLRTFASQAVVDLDRIRGDLETGAVTPEDALDRLRGIGDQLSGHMDALAGAVAVASSKKQKEQQLVREAMRRRRALGRRRSTTIISTTDPGWTWYSIDSFRAGYEAGRTEVQRSRSSSSSSGSTSGFSSSGGSFSGAGSSSRF
jgi:uncharacterized membrane protein YgcG